MFFTQSVLKLGNVDFQIIIPARLSSKRLPGKPLLDIHGVPMVVKVAKVCIDVAGLSRVFVSTPDKQILETCDYWGVPARESSEACISGTDRLAEYASETLHDRYINIQGDEPRLRESDLERFLDESFKFPGSSIAITKISDSREALDQNLVKVAISGRTLMYASRSPLASSIKDDSMLYFKHMGMYSYTREDLEKFALSGRSILEKVEEVEILRLLECGVEISTVEVSDFGKSIDTMADFLTLVKENFSTVGEELDE